MDLNKDKKNDDFLGEYDLERAMKQKDEVSKEEYEAFIGMHTADGIDNQSRKRL